MIRKEKIIICCLLIQIALAIKPPGYVEKPKILDENPPHYQYDYNISNDESDSQGHHEKRDGDNTSGNYFVKLPDGHSEVKYIADDWGYHPVVRYATRGAHSQVSGHFALGHSAVQALGQEGNTYGEPQKLVQPPPQQPQQPSQEIQQQVQYETQPQQQQYQNNNLQIVGILPQGIRGQSTFLVPVNQEQQSYQQNVDQSNYQSYQIIDQQQQSQVQVQEQNIEKLVANTQDLVSNKDVLDINSAVDQNVASIGQQQNKLESEQTNFEQSFHQTNEKIVEFNSPIVVDEENYGNAVTQNIQVPSREYLPVDNSQRQINVQILEDHNKGQFLKESIQPANDLYNQHLDQTDQIITDSTPSPQKEAPSRQFLKKFKNQHYVNNLPSQRQKNIIYSTTQSTTQTTTESYKNEQQLTVTQRPISNKFLAPIQAGLRLSNEGKILDDCLDLPKETEQKVEKKTIVEIQKSVNIKNILINQDGSRFSETPQVTPQPTYSYGTRITPRPTSTPCCNPPVTHIIEKSTPIFVDRVIEKHINVPVHIEKRIPYPVEVQKIVDRPVLIDRIVEKKVPYETIVEKFIDRPVHVEKIVEKPIHHTHYVDRPYPVEKIVEKPIHHTQYVDRPYPVEKIVEKPIHHTQYINRDRPYPVEKIVEKKVHVPYAVEKIVEKFIDRPYPVEKKVQVNVPVDRIVEKKVPYETIVEKIVDRPVPYPVQVNKFIDRPYPVEKVIEKFIDRPYPVEKQVKIPVHIDRIVEKKIPYETIVEKFVDRPYPVEKIVEKIVDRPVNVDRIVEKFIDRPYPVEKIVDRPVEVEKIVEKFIDRPYPVEKIVEKFIDRPYPVEKEVKVPVHTDRIVEVKVPYETIVEKFIDRPYPVEVQVQVPVHVPVQVPVQVPVHIPYPFEKHVPYPVPYAVQVPYHGHHHHQNHHGHHHQQFHNIPKPQFVTKQNGGFNLNNLFGFRQNKHIYLENPILTKQHGHSIYASFRPQITTSPQQHGTKHSHEKHFNGFTKTTHLQPVTKHIHLNNPSSIVQNVDSSISTHYGEKPKPIYGVPELAPSTHTTHLYAGNFGYQPLPAYSTAVYKDEYYGPAPLKTDFWNLQGGFNSGVKFRRHSDYGKNLRIEYGFKPPMIPSTEIDENGIPIINKEENL